MRVERFFIVCFILNIFLAIIVSFSVSAQSHTVVVRQDSSDSNWLTNDSLVLHQMYIKNKSLLHLLDSISNMKELSGSWNEFSLNISFKNDILVIGTGLLPADMILCIDKDEIDKNNYFGFISMNNSIFYVKSDDENFNLDYELFGIIKTHTLIVRPYKWIGPNNIMDNEGVYRYLPHYGTDYFIEIDGIFYSWNKSRAFLNQIIKPKY